MLRWTSVFTPAEPRREVDTKLTGTTWVYKTDPRFRAKVIGVVNRDGKSQRAKRVVIAKYAPRGFNFSVRPLRRFLEKYRREKFNLPDWSGIAADAEAKRKQCVTKVTTKRAA